MDPNARTNPDGEPLAASDREADGARLLAGTVAALGGEAFLNRETLTLTGTGEFSLPPQLGGATLRVHSFTYHIARGGRSRIEARTFGGRVVMGVRGHDRGGFVLIGGRTLDLPASHVNYMEVTEFLRAAHRDGFPTVAAPTEPGRADADGTPLLRYDVTPPDGPPVSVYVEAESKRPRRVEMTTPRGEKTVLLSGYGTLPFPELYSGMQLLENGANIIRLVATEAVIDEPLRPGLFERV
jgi:hypothetical protein